MKYEFNEVLHGILRYIDKEVYSGMNDLQEIAARVVIGRIAGNEEALKQSILNNGFIKTFGIIDADGKIELDDLLIDIKKEIAKKEKLTVDLSMFGKFTFKPSDVDVLYNTITGGQLRNENY